MVILGRILVFFGLVAILHAGYSAVQCKYFVLNIELSEIKHKHLHRLAPCSKIYLFFLCLGRTYYKLLEEEFPGLPADVRTRP